MNQQQLQSDVVYETKILERLRELYLNHTPLPTDKQAQLTIQHFYRLYRYIKAEGYGG